MDAERSSCDAGLEVNAAAARFLDRNLTFGIDTARSINLPTQHSLFEHKPTLFPETSALVKVQPGEHERK
jgi:hypothetical protein